MNVLLVIHPQNPVFVWVYPQKGTSLLKHQKLSKKGFYSPIYEIKLLKIHRVLATCLVYWLICLFATQDRKKGSVARRSFDLSLYLICREQYWSSRQDVTVLAEVLTHNTTFIELCLMRHRRWMRKWVVGSNDECATELSTALIKLCARAQLRKTYTNTYPRCLSLNLQCHKSWSRYTFVYKARCVLQSKAQFIELLTMDSHFPNLFQQGTKMYVDHMKVRWCGTLTRDLSVVLESSCQPFGDFLCKYVYIFMYIYVYINAYIYIYICMYMYAYVYIHMYIHTYLCIYVYICAYLYIHICIYIYIHTDTHINIYVNIHTYNYSGLCVNET